MLERKDRWISQALADTLHTLLLRFQTPEEEDDQGQ